MKKLVFVVVFATFISVFYFAYQSQNKITNFPSSGTDIIAFGDSLVLGVGSTQPGGFVRILSKDLDIPIINLGVSGDTTHSALDRVGQISKHNPKVVILLLGGNDFLGRVSKEETFDNLDRIIESIHLSGAVVLLVGLEDDKAAGGERHRELFEKLVRTRKTAYVADVLDGIFGRPEFMSDDLHPNDRGYRLMADRIEPILREVL